MFVISDASGCCCNLVRFVAGTLSDQLSVVSGGPEVKEEIVWSSRSGEDGGIGRGREGPFGAMLNNLTATALGGKDPKHLSLEI